MLALLFYRRNDNPNVVDGYWFFVFCPVLPMVIYGRRYLQLSRMVPEDLNRKMTVRIGLDEISVVAGEAVTILKWPAIKQLWKFQDLYLLFIYKNRPRFITIPTDSLNKETRMFIENKIKEHGGNVA